MMDTLPSRLPRISVIVAAYQRQDGVRRLLALLARQSLPPEAFEVVIVDDGSPSALSLDDVHPPFALRLIRQENTGPAGARDRAAREARGALLVVLDDDMQIGPDFLETHLRAHDAPRHRAVLGPIEPDPDVARLSLFEQWNAARLFRTSRLASSGAPLRGNSVWTGNVSLRRSDYLAVGGFDPELRVCEDQELGLKLEEAGVEIAFAPTAPVIHRSSHANATWLHRASLCGTSEKLVARKHPDALHADPWRYYYLLNRVVRPLMDLEIALPAMGAVVARVLLVLGQLLLRLGARGRAIQVAATVYAIEYIRGVRLAEGSRRACVVARRAYLARAATLPELPPGVPRRRAHWSRMRADLTEDRTARLRFARADAASRPGASDATPAPDPGARVMAAVRLMAFFRDARYPRLARAMSRLIRQVYGSDIHWDARWGPGVTLVRGFGLVVSHAARIGPDCVLFPNVSLHAIGPGTSIASTPPVSGAPTLGRAVHVGPGAMLVGPIVIGARTRVMAGAVLSASVPSGSLVTPPRVRVQPQLGRASWDRRDRLGRSYRPAGR